MHINIAEYLINTVSLLHVHVMATIVAILREESYKRYIAKPFKNQCTNVK